LKQGKVNSDKSETVYLSKTNFEKRESRCNFFGCGDWGEMEIGFWKINT